MQKKHKLNEKGFQLCIKVFSTTEQSLLSKCNYIHAVMEYIYFADTSKELQL